MRVKEGLGAAVSVAVCVLLLAPPASAVMVQPQGWVTFDGAIFKEEYWQDGNKWLSNVTNKITIWCFHGAYGEMTVYLYDPNGNLRMTHNPPGNTHTYTVVQFNLNDYFNSTGKMSGIWHLYWTGHEGGLPTSGHDYLYVGMLAVDRTTSIGTQFYEERELAAGVMLPTKDGYGVAGSIAVTLVEVTGEGNRRDLVVKIACLHSDLMYDGSTGRRNSIESIRINIVKVAFSGWGTTGTGSSGSWYNSGVYMSQPYGFNVTLAGGSPEPWAIGAAGYAIVTLATFAGGPIVGIPAGLLMYIITSGYASSGGALDQSPYKSTDTQAKADFNKNSDHLYNSTAILNSTLLQWDASKSLSYAFMIWGEIKYYNSNPPATWITKSTPAIYLLVNNA